MTIVAKKIVEPTLTVNSLPIDLTQETMNQRKENLLEQMRVNHLDVVVIYADREHGANFEYFTGFLPRFEEALCVIHQNGKTYLLLGNENTKMVNYARISAELIHVPFFSLPNQPMQNDDYFINYLKQAEISTTHHVAAIGWKNFSSSVEQNQTLYDIPYFIVDALKKLVDPTGLLINGASLLIAPETGIRTVNNANELVHYEYGATLAGIGVLNTLNRIAVGKTELELAQTLAKEGQPTNVTTICATGERFTQATLYPRNKPVTLGDPFSLTVSYKGGLSSRAAYVARGKADLPLAVQEYEINVTHPYFNALVTWLQTIKIGSKAKEVYQAIEHVLPKNQYHWTLNPGHYVADEEWLASPFYQESTAKIKSGQLFQLDIIPKVAGYGGVGCEDGVALADQALREEIQRDYPEVWDRFVRRRKYISECLGIELSEEILPMNDIVCYYRPFLLNQELALVIEK